MYFIAKRPITTHPNARLGNSYRESASDGLGRAVEGGRIGNSIGRALGVSFRGGEGA